MQPVEEIRYLILAIQREGQRMLTDALRPYVLTPSQAEVLRVLQEHQPLSLIALGQLLVCEGGSPSRLVNGLVEVGLIERLPSTTNGRMITLTLTAAGEAKAREIKEVEEKLYDWMRSQLEGEDLAHLIKVLWRFTEGRPAGDALARRAGRLIRNE
jgi:DNA-binding MarR family transcriptional regulator